MTEPDQYEVPCEPVELGEASEGVEYEPEADDLDQAEPDDDPLIVEQIYSETPAVEGAPQNARPEDAPALGMSTDGGGS